MKNNIMQDEMIVKIMCSGCGCVQDEMAVEFDKFIVEEIEGGECDLCEMKNDWSLWL
jgi:hypothetical protein